MNNVKRASILRVNITTQNRGTRILFQEISQIFSSILSSKGRDADVHPAKKKVGQLPTETKFFHASQNRGENAATQKR